MSVDRLARADGAGFGPVLTQALQAVRAELSVEVRLGRGGLRAVHRYSEELDEIVRRISVAARERTDTPFALLALGGYGRKQLCLHSDIDLLVVFEGRIGAAEERFLKALLHPLWDLRLQVGHQVREVSELRTVDEHNPEFLVAVLDARYVDGDTGVYEQFKALCHRDGSPWRPATLAALIALVEQRHAQFNGTLYQLEPDIKDAPGGLRDIWASRAIAGLVDAGTGHVEASDWKRLGEAEDFLLRIRSILHLERERNVNTLSHSLQEKVAAVFGCPGSHSQQQVEALMSAYFHHARLIARLLRSSVKMARPPAATGPAVPAGENLELAAEGVRFVDAARASLQPHTWLRAFRVARDRNCGVSSETLACIERHGGRYGPEQFFPTEVEQDLFLRFLRPGPGLYDRLSEMHECGLLGRMFPEFQKIYCRVIRDFYHKYTVDEHTLLTIRSLESLCQPQTPSRRRFGNILQELDSPEILVMALLFHDVGKWTDVNHAEESVRLVRGALARLQVVPEFAETVEFLIRHHLEMSRAAFRRDTEDPQVVRQFANLVGTERHLKLLCLMTLVDIEAVSPETLTPWKEELLWRLYVDTYNQLTLGYGDEAIETSHGSLVELLRERPPDVTEAELINFLDGLPKRYLRLVDRASVYDHVRLSRNIHPLEVHSALAQKDDVWELSVVTLDKPQLFSNICGVLSYFGMDIVRGQAMTKPHGVVLDLFQFIDADGFFRMNPTAMPQFYALLEDVVAGRVDVSATLRGKEQGLLRKPGPVRVRPVVHFDDHYSQRHTILEIVAQDAWGLLYRISRVISRHKCDIDLVLISTEGNRAIDVFHITQNGGKLTEAAQRALGADLIDVLTKGHEADQSHRPTQQGR